MLLLLSGKQDFRSTLNWKKYLRGFNNTSTLDQDTSDLLCTSLIKSLVYFLDNNETDFLRSSLHCAHVKPKPSLVHPKLLVLPLILIASAFPALYKYVKRYAVHARKRKFMWKIC